MPLLAPKYLFQNAKLIICPLLSCFLSNVDPFVFEIEKNRLPITDFFTFVSMETNISPLIFNEFGAPECSWNEAKSSAKKRQLGLIYFILVADLFALTATLIDFPYSAFDIFQIVIESLILVVLLPKALGIGNGIRHLSVDRGVLKIQNGIVFRKKVPLSKLDKVSVSKKRNSHRRLVLHFSNGKKEETRFFLYLSIMEDKRRMLEWIDEINKLISNR